MIFLLTQMLAGLICALVAGGAIGWLLCRARLQSTVKALRDTVQRQSAQVEQARTDVSLISQDFDELEHRSREQIDALTDENRRLPPLHHNLEKSQLLVRQLMQKHEAQLRDLAVERDTLRARLAKQADREDALRSVSAELDQARRRLVTIDIPSLSHGAANTDSLHTDSLHTGDDTPASGAAPSSATDAGPDGQTDADTGPDTITAAVADTVSDAGDAGDDDDTVDAGEGGDTVEAATDTTGPATSSWASARVPDVAPRQVAGEDTVPGTDSSHGIAPDTDGQATPAPHHDPDPDPLLDDAIELDELDAAPEHEQAQERTTVSSDSAGAAVGPVVDPVIDDGTGLDGRNAADAPLFDPVDRHDDLKQIFGIGPMTEKALNRLGITSYSQLAELERHDIETIADALQIFPDRIERDDWVGNARRQLEDVLEEL